MKLLVPRRPRPDNRVKQRHQRMRLPRFHRQKRELIRRTQRLHRHQARTLQLEQFHPQKEILTLVRRNKRREQILGMLERLRLQRIRLVVIRRVLDLIEPFRWASSQIRCIRSISVVLTGDRLGVTRLLRTPAGTQKSGCGSAAL
jgi:hypothetical protein